MFACSKLLVLSLLTVVTLVCHSWATCDIWEAVKYRDCHCSMKFLDYERHCYDDNTYYRPTLHQDTKYCEFQCKNGGTAHGSSFLKICSCSEGWHGQCCERGECHFGELVVAIILTFFFFRNKVWVFIPETQWIDHLPRFSCPISKG